MPNFIELALELLKRYVIVLIMKHLRLGNFREMKRAFFLAAAFTLLATNLFAEWVPSPPPPPVTPWGPEGKFTEDNSLTLRFLEYRPGVIELAGFRIEELIQKIEAPYVDIDGLELDISTVEITGLSDKLEIASQRQIWRSIPISIRPKRYQDVDNDLIARARAQWILEEIVKQTDLVSPAIVELEAIPNLEVGGANRGIWVVLQFHPNLGFGLEEMD